MFNEAKQLVPANASASSSSTLSAISKVGNDLSMLKNDIDTKAPYDKVATFANSTITPDLKEAFKL
jgi:hypothetical protein